jgi:predicted permease
MMNELLAILTIVGFFILRLGIPILLIILVGYLMSRLDARWQMQT